MLCHSNDTNISLQNNFSNNLLSVEQHQPTLIDVLHGSSSLSCMSGYLAVDSGSANNLHALVAMWQESVAMFFQEKLRVSLIEQVSKR